MTILLPGEIEVTAPELPVVMVQSPAPSMVTTEAPAPVIEVSSPPVPTIVNEAPPTPPMTLVLPIAGPAGAPGRDGAPGTGGGTILNRTAGDDLGGDRLVWEQPDGTVVYADNTDTAHMVRPVFLTLTAATNGSSISLLAIGEHTETTWSFTPGPIYLGTAGALTQTPPNAPAFQLQVGAALTATSILFNPQPPIRLE